MVGIILVITIGRWFHPLISGPAGQRLWADGLGLELLVADAEFFSSIAHQDA